MCSRCEPKKRGAGGVAKTAGKEVTTDPFDMLIRRAEEDRCARERIEANEWLRREAVRNKELEEEREVGEKITVTSEDHNEDKVVTESVSKDDKQKHQQAITTIMNNILAAAEKDSTLSPPSSSHTTTPPFIPVTTTTITTSTPPALHSRPSLLDTLFSPFFKPPPSSSPLSPSAKASEDQEGLVASWSNSSQWSETSSGQEDEGWNILGKEKLKMKGKEESKTTEEGDGEWVHLKQK